MAITPTHLDPFRNASPSSIPPAGETLAGSTVTSTSDQIPKTAFHRRFFGTELEERLTKRLDSVQVALAEVVRENADSVKTNVSEVNRDLGVKIDGVDGNVRNVDDKVTPVEDQFNSLRASVGDDLNARVSDLAPKLDAVNASVGANLGEQVGKIADKLGVVSTSVGIDLATRVDAVGSQLKEVAGHVTTEAGAVREAVAKLTEKVCAVEGAVTESKRDLVQLLECVGQIKACVDKLERQLCESTEPAPGGAPKPRKP